MAGRSKRVTTLYTLTEIAKKTGISMPTLQRYKRLYQERIPSEGEGRKQRYPQSSLKVFNEIKKENIGRRGRPRKSAVARKPAAGVRKPKASSRKSAASSAKPEATKSDLLTLTEISRRTGISYPTLTRYVKKFGDRLNSEGTGRLRRFYEDAVSVFQELRADSRGGGRKKKTVSRSTGSRSTASRKIAPKKTAGRKSAAQRIISSEKPSEGDVALIRRVVALEKQLKALQKKLSRPIRFTVLPS